MGADQSNMCCSSRGSGGSERGARQSNGVADRSQAENINPASQSPNRLKMVSPGENKSVEQRVGIGAYFQPSQYGLQVKSLLIGSPAAKTGRIQVGDIIVTVDDEDVLGKRLPELASLILGAPGSRVKLSFKSVHTGKTYDMELERGTGYA